MYMSLCLDVNQGGTNRNHYTQTLVIVVTQEKPGHSDLLYWVLGHDRKKHAHHVS